MSLADTIKKLVSDFIRDTMIITLERINSNGREPIILRHSSGASVELRDDGDVYVNGAEVLTGSSIPDPLEVSTIQSKSGDNMLIESDTGVFVFRTRV